MTYPLDPDPKLLGKLEAETIAYDSLMLQRIVRCGPSPVTINGWERHWVLAMATDVDESGDIDER